MYLTNLEIKVLSSFGKEQPIDEWNSLWLIETYSKIDTKIIRGVLSSLVKKNVIESGTDADGNECFRIVNLI